jgi:amidase
MAALGTETDGSIMSPSSFCGIVGIKPTVGLTSRDGVIPISHTQDTVGPHARTVRDAAHVLGAITETPGCDYTLGLRPDALRGARIGVARAFHTGYSEHTDRVFEMALDVLRQCGAELLDPIELPGYAEVRANLDDNDSSEGIVLEYEFKADIEHYLAGRPSSPLRCLADLIRFNEEHAAEEMPYFGQELFLASERRGPLSDELYQRALACNRAFGQRFAELLREQRLSALVAPTNAPAWSIDFIDGDRRLGGSAKAAAIAGFPLLTVPAGFVFDLLPIGLTFMGPPQSEATLIQLGYAFEQAHPVRRAPHFVPTALNLP